MRTGRIGVIILVIAAVTSASLYIVDEFFWMQVTKPNHLVLGLFTMLMLFLAGVVVLTEIFLKLRFWLFDRLFVGASNNG